MSTRSTSARRAGGGAREHFGQLIGRRVAHQDLEEEPVKLRFRQRVGAFLVNRVLRRHDEERLDQLAQFAARGDLVLLHGFEQGRLGLRRRAVDFVRQHQVREDRPALELELAPPAGHLHDDVRAENIRRHQVGGELDAAEREVQHFAERAHEQRLAQPGHPFEQHMPAREQRDERALDDGVLADNDFAELRPQRGVGLAEGLDLFFGIHVPSS